MSLYTFWKISFEIGAPDSRKSIAQNIMGCLTVISKMSSLCDSSWGSVIAESFCLSIVPNLETESRQYTSMEVISFQGSMV